MKTFFEYTCRVVKNNGRYNVIKVNNISDSVKTIVCGFSQYRDAINYSKEQNAKRNTLISYKS
jgi:hypothetical protein